MNTPYIKNANLVIWLLITILSMHVVFILFNLYNEISWLDITMHFTGGIWVAFLFLYLFGRYIKDEMYINFSGGIKALIILVSFVALVGVLWEFFEFTLSNITSMNMQGDLADTMSDLFVDILGGTIAGFFSIKALYSRKKIK